MQILYFSCLTNRLVKYFSSVQFFKDIYGIFFPKMCINCGQILSDEDEILCIDCLHLLPETHFTALKANLTERAFYGRIDIVAATSLYYLRKNGIVQKLIYQLKYNNNQKIGRYFGHKMAYELEKSGRFKELECIVPVPLHPKKKRKRGYNQLTLFGKTIAATLGIPYVEDKLIRKSVTTSQTKKSRWERFKNAKEIYVNNEVSFFVNKNVLLIDDVFTTGATLEACTKALQKSNGIKVSLATMACVE